MKKAGFVFVAASLFAACVALASCAGAKGGAAGSDGGSYAVEFSPLKKIRADEEFEFVMRAREGGEAECVPVSIGVVWQYAVDHRILLNGKDGDEAEDVSVKIAVEIRQKSTGKPLCSFDIDEDLSEPCGMMLMGKEKDSYKGCKPFDDGDYEFVITEFLAKKGKGKYIKVPEASYEVRILK